VIKIQDCKIPTAILRNWGMKEKRGDAEVLLVSNKQEL
jgi:hypothetical protein